MLEAAGRLQAVLDGMNIRDAAVPVISNYQALPQRESAQIRANLVKQIHSSVLWEGSMRYILSQGVTKFVEFGPGKVLKGLMRRIEPSAVVSNIEKKDDILKFV
jgi:[acyl-carrier-protein] S-malonyltransferase